MPISKIEPFSVDSQNWDSYVRRLKQFITLNSIDDGLKVATLLTLVGGECYNLLCDLCSPDHPEDKEFDELVELLKHNLEPEKSEIAERHSFRERTQLQGESIRLYLQGLKHLAKTCNFGSKLEENLRDQFVSGLYSEEMRSRIFAEKDIDYKRAVELASALEAAERHASTAGAPVGGEGAGADALHRVSGNGPAARARASGAGRSGGAGGAAASSGGGGDRAADARVPCARCGRATHTPSKCRYKNFTCDLCGMKGHLKVMCLNKSNHVGPIGKAKSKGQYFINNHSDSEGDDGNFYNLITGGEGDRPYYATLFVNYVKCKFEIDTGSKISAISKTFYDKYFNHIVMHNKKLILKSYTGDTIDTLGYIDVDVRFGQNSAKLKLYVVENGGPPLMGRTWIKELKLTIVECHKITERDSIASKLKREYPEVFAEGLGTFKSCIRLHLNDKKPVFVKARPLPLALRERVATELERLQREGVIYKVDRSDYGTPIVPVIKSNGDIRICAGGEQYTKLDLSNAFQQCLLHEESRAMTAIITHVGTFVYRRVPFGIKCIPENFQKIMEETLNGLPSTAVFADDICITDVKWVWTHKCDKAFIKIKELLSSAPVLANYDPELPLILAVDSSAYGLGAVLMQRGADDRERPVSCASRALNAAECNYSQLDKEALAIVFGVTKHH
ncbi:uncharacterized protein K02A2.6-like [Vanessa atalanta]|uniref:uncharacterized protein K02A2.6-like n=1 Tax=Vanessa atalanta TaxID=42275 RepID=UPI001FCDE9BA|nr:uncharacterized protein K02A2.6-like [Vanessa atalanta]